MPIYEYVCNHCGREQEYLLNLNDDDPLCEDCGKNTLNRKLSVFAVAPNAVTHESCACGQQDSEGCCGGMGGGCGC